MNQFLNKIKNFKTLSVQAKASVAYTFASFFSKGINIITVPIFTRLMESSEIGVGTTYHSWYTILYAIASLSLYSGSLNIAMMDYKDNRSDYQSSILTLSTISGVIFSALFILFSVFFKGLTKLDMTLTLFLCVSMIINPALDSWYARQRYEYQYKKTVTVTILIAVLSAIISILFVLVAKANSYSGLGTIKTISQAAVTLTFSLFFYIYILKNGKTFISLSIWKYALKLSLPLIVHSVSKNILDVSDRIMISSICGQSEAGIYGTVYNIAMVSLLVWNAVNVSLIPISFELLEEDEKEKLNKTILPFLLLFGGVSITITLFAPELLSILAPKEYSDAVYLVPALSAGVYFTALYNVYGNLLLFKKKTVNIMIATMIAAISNVVLNYFCIHLYGYIAAAYTTLVSFVILAAFQGIMVRIIYKSKVINDSLYFIVSIIVALLSISCNLVYRNTLLRYIFIVCIILIAILFRDKIKEMISKK